MVSCDIYDRICDMNLKLGLKGKMIEIKKHLVLLFS